MYKIIDLQGDNGFSLTHEVFKTKKEIIKRLADFHSVDWSDERYKTIYSWLRAMKFDRVRLNQLLEYGQWDIEKV